MKSIVDSFRNRRLSLRGLSAGAHDLYTGVAQGVTVLRIAALVLVLYVKFMLEHLLDCEPNR
jgi:hypothetical protein